MSYFLMVGGASRILVKNIATSVEVILIQCWQTVASTPWSSPHARMPEPSDSVHGVDPRIAHIMTYI